jgi:hypothetical protein
MRAGRLPLLPMKKLFVLATAVALVGCRGCDSGVKRVKPVIGVSPVSLDFGKVKVGTSATLPVTIESQSKAELTITSAAIEGASAGSFKLGEVPATVAQLSTSKLEITFTPSNYEAYGAVLVIASSDEEHPKIEVSLTGEGAKAKISVTPECDPVRKCTGSVVVNPPSIDFGAEPFQRLLAPDPTTLPDVSIISAGDVDLVVKRIEITGADKAAFKFIGNATLPAGGLILEPTAGRTIAMQLKPTSETQQSYVAVLEIESDDADNPLIKVNLKGALRPNLPPVLCANLIKVDQGDSTVSRYDTKPFWDLLLVPPAGGYDFGKSREVQPNSYVTFSALSDPDETKCTTDPEDGRAGVEYLWEPLSWPNGAVPLTINGNKNSQATMRVGALTGEYVVKLTVTDVQKHATTTTLKFTVAIRQDLVAQVSWIGYPNIDLDVHLVRPSSQTTTDPFSGAFSFFEEAPTSKTCGDINGWAANYKRTNTGVDFDWGDPGTADDPKLNLDEQGGSVTPVENVSVNYPEDDPRCATGPCRYKVMVHYFKDARNALPDGGTPGPCQVNGTSCKDGERCNCTDTATRCVANDAPNASAPTGAGKCIVPPQPTVRIFVKANPTPAAVIPLDTLSPADRLELAAPCQMLYVADVIWPQRSDAGIDAGAVQVIIKGQDDAGYITSPVIQRFGVRSNGSTGCSPNTTKGGQAWYAPAP